MPRSKPKTPTKQYNILLNESDRSHLDMLAEMQELSSAQLIRSLIRGAYAMSVMGAPSCSNGSPCLVPAAHQVTKP